MSAHVVLAKNWKRSRTIWVNAAAALAAASAWLAIELPNFRERIPPGVYLSVGFGIAILNVWLRFRTDAPIGTTPVVPEDDHELGEPRER